MTKAETTIFSASFRAVQPLACALFEAAILRGQVANGYLLTGRASEDKLTLARQLTAYLNCEKVKQQGLSASCLVLGEPPAGATADTSGWCLNCQWIGQDNHPQAWLLLTGEGKSNKIPVEKVRNLTEELSKTSNFSRVVLAPMADEVTFHRPAANALLKSIEEPPDNCLFFFFADGSDDVLATIVSRCQVVPLTKPLKLGYWLQSNDPRQQMSAELKGKLEAARSAFILNARRYTGAQAQAGGQLKTTTDGLELNRQLIDLCKELFESMSEQEGVEQVLDLVVASELEVHRQEACTNPQRASYLSRVVDAAEKAKRQVNSYVKASNVVESFSLALSELRHTYQGEPSLAKR